jgi:hypothetical protein
MFKTPGQATENAWPCSEVRRRGRKYSQGSEQRPGASTQIDTFEGAERSAQIIRGTF